MHQIDEKANLRLVNFLFLGNLIFFHPPLIFAFNTEVPSPSHPADPSQQHEHINEVSKGTTPPGRSNHHL
jgi:hypothetical protein